MIEQRLRHFMSSRHCTLLGVGPMSKNCVDAAIEISNEESVPLMLIASRRQIESKDQGSGYVNSWSTEDFCQYVLDNDKKGQIILARDHGGPWQSNHEVEKKMSLRTAMESAKKSFEVDIKSGMQFIHIDPSIDIFQTPKVEDILERLFELYEFCWSTAKRHGKEIIFEIGTEEQSGGSNSLGEIQFVLDQVFQFCDRNRFSRPFMIVVQTGTRVMEMRNVGSFDSPFRIAGEIPAEIQLPRMLDLCRQNNIFVKEHNGDYLSDEAIAWHPHLGIHATNVAPEFGVAESKALAGILIENQLEALNQEFLEIAFQSGKYKKWLTPQSAATDSEKALMCGHYIFSSQAFIDLKMRAELALRRKNINLDQQLKLAVKKSILRYVTRFGLAQ